MKLPRQAATGITPQRWSPPSTWSKCAKCKLEVNAFITASIAGAGYLTGVPTPGTIAVVQSILAGAYGAAAANAAIAVIFSQGVDAASKQVCRSRGYC